MTTTTFRSPRGRRLAGALQALWVRALLGGRAIEQGALDAFLGGLTTHPRAEVARYVRGLAARVTVITAVVLAVLHARREPGAVARFYQRFVGEADPRAVGVLRIATAGVALLYVSFENVADTAVLPRELARAHGAFALLQALPGTPALASSPEALAVFEGLSATVLAAAMLGLFTRITLPLGALVYFVCISLLRQPTWAYHTGLIPFYLLTFLALAPWVGADPGAALTLDRRAREPVSREAAGWVRFGWVALLFLPYVEAGLSKLCNAGPLWVGPTNMRAILFMDSLDPMEFDFDGGLLLQSAPAAVFVFLGLAGMLGEIGMVFALTHRWGKRLFPAAMIGMHAGIVLLQNVFFPDLILLLIAFYAMALLYDRGTGSPFDLSFAPARESVRDAPLARRRATRLLGVTVAVMGAFWMLAIEWFPFTAMQMYAKVRGPEVEYVELHERTAEGWRRGRPDEVFPSLLDGRYRLALRRCFDDEGPDPRCDLFLASYLEARGPEVAELRVEKHRWNFVTAPDDADHGEVIGVHRLRR
ncbi:MAG: hypothetical protein AAGH15_01220 [Myxococcota bacterium]